MSREALLVRTLVELADSLVDEFDVVDLLSKLADRCVDLLDVSAAGVMLCDPGGELRLVASSDEAMRVVELLELQSEEGPCPECYRTGEPVAGVDVAEAVDRWPRFGPAAIDAGFRWVQAQPLRYRGRVIGALNLFSPAPTVQTTVDAIVARALADVATLAIVQRQTAREAQVLNEQLTHALNSRVVIEQAKGVLAERANISLDDAFFHLRTYARSTNQGLSDICHALADGSLTVAEVDRVVIPRI